ncbi:MAG: extracellular solute-binding protein [Chloroflexi bacterium]|nr:extracellular solute-binding protein [Chloroflexota bacterium]
MKIQRTVFFSLFILTAMLLGACAPQAAEVAPAIPSPGVSGSLPGAAAEPWQQQWQQLEAAARKEGRIVLYSSSGPGPREALAQRLLEKYGIEIDYLTARSAELSPKIDTERRAGLFIPDVYQGGGGVLVQDLKPKGFLDPIGPILLLPEVTNSALWVENSLNFIDKERTVISYVATATTPIVYNSDLVQVPEIKSYRDLLAPKWKGKLMLNDPTVNGPGIEWYGVVKNIMGLEFMRQLAAQEPSVALDHRLQTEWLARGKYSILIAPNDAIVSDFVKAGASLKGIIPVEGSVLKTGAGSVALMNRAPHPNAARLYINWLLTREAQTLLQKVMGQQSARLDVPTDSLEPDKVRQEGVKYVYVGSEEDYLSRLDSMGEAKKIFGHLIIR